MQDRVVNNPELNWERLKNSSLNQGSKQDGEHFDFKKIKQKMKCQRFLNHSSNGFYIVKMNHGYK